jgi:hypothetical protein
VQDSERPSLFFLRVLSAQRSASAAQLPAQRPTLAAASAGRLPGSCNRGKCPPGDAHRSSCGRGWAASDGLADAAEEVYKAAAVAVALEAREQLHGAGGDVHSCRKMPRGKSWGAFIERGLESLAVHKFVMTELSSNDCRRWKSVGGLVWAGLRQLW